MATDLSFLKNYGRKQVSLEDIKKIVEGLKSSIRQGIPQTEIAEQLSHDTRLSIGAIVTLIGELKKASKAGMSLEEYLEKGRPFRPGKKVLAEP